MNNDFKPSLKVKKYNFKERENQIFLSWQKEKAYSFHPKKITKKEKIFVIDTPPPYTNAPWHMGGAIHYSQIDMIARSMRMNNKIVHFPMGLDRNGLPIEIATEKEFNVNMHEIPRKEFLDLCQKILDKVGDKILNVCYKLGLSCNSFEWDFVYKTDNPIYRALTQATFIELWYKGLIYEDNRPNNWDSALQTTVADAEIEYKEGIHSLYNIKFQIKETKESYYFSTTRPELIPAIRLIVFNPNDTRYLNLEGKTAIIPIWGISVKIIAHPMADPNFGTGLVQICSYGDIQDVWVLRELNIDPIYAIDIHGNLTKETGKYAGLTIQKGRKAIIKDLEAMNAISFLGEIPYRYPVSERSGVQIEFIGMPEYYLKQESYLKILNEYCKKMEFHPSSMKQLWQDWLDRISLDWPITRRRFYGTEVPIWYCKKCKNPMLPKPGKYYQPWRDKPPFEKCTKCNSTEFIGDERTLDTWMDSSISPLYICKYPNNQLNENFLKLILTREYFCDIRTQGKEIVRTWLHYSMLRIHQLYNKPAFAHAWISGHVVTESGEKMSKSKGNSIQPEPILEKYGGDALRLFGTMEASNGSDIRFSEERLKGGAKFLNKLYNIARFISSFPNEKDAKPIYESDKWILYELDKVIKECKEGYELFDFHPVTVSLRYFITEIFSSHYMELVKNRAYNKNGSFSEIETNSARYTLYLCLDAILKLLAPITPFITDYIYRELNGNTIHKKLFPEKMNIQFIEITDLLLSYNRLIWKIKQDNQKSLKEPLNSITLPESLKIFEKDLSLMHNIQKFSNEGQNETVLMDNLSIKYSL